MPMSVHGLVLLSTDTGIERSVVCVIVVASLEVAALRCDLTVGM